MRALPGRATRTELGEPSEVTRENFSEAQRRRIRRATGELIAKRGYSGTSVELIIKRAKVSFKTFYTLYANKEEAFIDLFERARLGTEAEVRETLADSGEQWPERVALALRTFFAAIAAEPLIARACLVEAPTAGSALLEHYERVAKAFVPLLSEGREQSPEAAELPVTLEDTLAGSVLWAAYQCLTTGEIDRIPELLPEQIELVLRPYIGKRRAHKVAAAVQTA